MRVVVSYSLAILFAKFDIFDELVLRKIAPAQGMSFLKWYCTDTAH